MPKFVAFRTFPRKNVELIDADRVVAARDTLADRPTSKVAVAEPTTTIEFQDGRKIQVVASLEEVLKVLNGEGMNKLPDPDQKDVDDFDKELLGQGEAGPNSGGETRLAKGYAGQVVRDAEGNEQVLLPSSGDKAETLRAGSGQEQDDKSSAREQTEGQQSGEQVVGSGEPTGDATAESFSTNRPEGASPAESQKPGSSEGGRKRNR